MNGRRCFYRRLKSIAGSGDMEAAELHPASESALLEGLIGRRILVSVGDDGPMVLERLESDSL